MQKLDQIYKLLIAFSLLFLLSACDDKKDLKTPLEPTGGVVSNNALSYLNSLRLNSNLSTLSKNDVLTTSAQNHAKYTFINKVDSHNEVSNLPNFTGQTPKDRAFSVGYFTQISENLSVGAEDEVASIDGLMSAIYHRFGFLDTKINEIGYAKFGDEKSQNFVYNMGNSKLNDFCKKAKSDDGYGKFYTKVCKNENVAISGDKYNSLNRIDKNEYVYFPNSSQTKAFFSRETPDPMPECKITANPISIEFNEFRKPVKMKSFKVFENENELKNSKILTKQNDPNSIFNEFQFAFFSKDVFKFNQDYKVLFSYIQDNKEKNLEWSFKTSSPKFPYFVVKDGDKIGVETNKWYSIFFEPNDCNDVFTSYKTTYRFMKKPLIESVDTNLININLSGSKNAKLTIKTDNGKKITVYITNSSGGFFINKLYLGVILVIVLALFFIIRRR